jgi:hypothetical protein
LTARGLAAASAMSWRTAEIDLRPATLCGYFLVDGYLFFNSHFLLEKRAYNFRA